MKITLSLMEGSSAGFTRQWDFPNLQGEDVYAVTTTTQPVKLEDYSATAVTET